MSAHSSGPWAFEKWVDGRLYVTFGAAGGSLCLADEPRQIDFANARLIAAAPELLEALIEFVAPAEGLPVGERSLMARARAAIKKATEA